MALNITFDGYVYLNDGSISNANVKYQAMFYPNGTLSSSLAWNVYDIVDSNGYYNFNLGDSDLLTTEGVVLNNSKVILVFWKGSATDRNSLSNIDSWGATEITIDGSSVYTTNVQIKNNIEPILVWTLTSSGTVNTTYSTTNTSYDTHSWTYSGITMNHWKTRYSQNINLINSILKTDYYWGDATSDLSLSGASVGSHQWSNPGIYTVSGIVYDNSNTYTIDTKDITIKYHTPTADITMSPSDPLPNESISFIWSGTDIDNTITSIDWTIHDTGTYGNTDTEIIGLSKDEYAYHYNGLGTSWYGVTSTSGAFTNPSSHIIDMTIYYNDGFDDLSITYSKTFTQDKFTGPTVRFSQSPLKATVGSGIYFTNTSTNTDRVGLGTSGYKYDWTWNDGSTHSHMYNTEYSYQYGNTPSGCLCSTVLTANWNDGWIDQTTTYSGKAVFSPLVKLVNNSGLYTISVSGTTDSGTADYYGWTVHSGSNISGPWHEVWSSPVDAYQQTKRIAFAETGWYKFTGTIADTNENSTSTSGIMRVTETGHTGTQLVKVYTPNMYSKSLVHSSNK